VAAAIEAIGQSPEPLLAWIHSRGMAGAWDAPREFRERFVDAEDPAPPDFTMPPERRLDRHVDPDEILGLVQAYGGQVQLADECLEMLLAAIDERQGQDRTLLAVASPRGYPLGEHGRVGACDEALYSELLQVPLMIQLPQGAGRLARTRRIVQTSSVFATIAEACNWGELNETERAASLIRDVQGEENTVIGQIAVAIAPGQRAIRTPAWHLRESHEAGTARQELFAKPDDRWEANEVSSRCGDVAALLAAEADRFEQAARAGQLAALAPPAELLCDMWH
jgi:arylsulfatase A-like enzyme